LPLQFEGAGIGGVDAGDDLHQGRLAGAVLAHQRMHMSALETELNVVEREHAGKGFADVGDFKQILGAGHGPALSDDLGGRRTDGRHGAPRPEFLARPFSRGPAKNPSTTKSSAKPEAAESSPRRRPYAKSK